MAKLRHQERSNPVQAYTAPVGLVQRAQVGLKTLSPADVMYLQRIMGNRAVVQLLRRRNDASTERTSELRVGPSNVVFEQEARQTGQSLNGRAPGIQRVTDADLAQMSDKDLKQAIKKQNKKIRAHKTKDKARQFGWKALDMALTAPLHLIDQASVLDLHAKDFVNYVKTGKTRDQRNRPRLMDPSNTDFDKREKRQEYLKSKLKREYGRTGFRPYLSGTDWHHFLYGNPMEQRSNRLSWYGKFNPFSRLSEKRNKKYKNIQTGWVSPRAGLRDEKKQYRDELARRRQGVVAPNDIVC